MRLASVGRGGRGWPRLRLAGLSGAAEAGLRRSADLRRLCGSRSARSAKSGFGRAACLRRLTGAGSTGFRRTSRLRLRRLAGAGSAKAGLRRSAGLRRLRRRLTRSARAGTCRRRRVRHGGRRRALHVLHRHELRAGAHVQRWIRRLRAAVCAVVHRCRLRERNRRYNGTHKHQCRPKAALRRQTHESPLRTCIGYCCCTLTVASDRLTDTSTPVTKPCGVLMTARTMRLP